MRVTVVAAGLRRTSASIPRRCFKRFRHRYRLYRRFVCRAVPRDRDVLTVNPPRGEIRVGATYSSPLRERVRVPVVCVLIDPSAGSPTDTLLRLLHPPRTDVQKLFEHSGECPSDCLAPTRHWL